MKYSQKRAILDMNKISSDEFKDLIGEKLPFIIMDIANLLIYNSLTNFALYSTIYIRAYTIPPPEKEVAQKMKGARHYMNKISEK